MTSTLPPRIQAASGAVGATLANAITYPLDLVVTRIQLSNRTKLYPGDVATAKHIISRTLKKQGVSGLYSGLESDSIANMTSNFIYFYIYSYLRATLIRRRDNSPGDKAQLAAMLSVPEELLIGFLSGVASKGLTTPLSVITVQLQSEDDDEVPPDSHRKNDLSSHPTPSNAVMRVVYRIYSDSGLGGFWKGMSTTVILSANPALTMLFLQAFRRIFLHGKDRERPTGAQGFLGGALSNTLALLLLYPLVLSKTKLQSYSKNGGKKPTLLSIIQDTLNQHGLAAMYQGLLTQLLKGFFNQGVTIMVKQRIEKGVVQLYHYAR